jgi:hypothetical protein
MPNSHEMIAQSFDFLKQEEDLKNLEKLSTIVLEKYYTDKELLQKVFTYYLTQKDRKKIFDIVFMLALRNSCLRKGNNFKNIKSSDQLCSWIEKSWVEGLWNLPFYDTTAVTLNEIQENIRAGQCELALSKAEDLERREGPLKSLLNSLQIAYTCLKNPDKLQSLSARIESLRIFGR